MLALVDAAQADGVADEVHVLADEALVLGDQVVELGQDVAAGAEHVRRVPDVGDEGLVAPSGAG